MNKSFINLPAGHPDYSRIVRVITEVRGHEIVSSPDKNTANFFVELVGEPGGDVNKDNLPRIFVGDFSTPKPAAVQKACNLDITTGEVVKWSDVIKTAAA